MALKRWIIGLALLVAPTAWGQVFGPCTGSYTASNSSGACTVSNIGGGGGNFNMNGTNAGTTPGASGGIVHVVPGGTTHLALNMNYHTTVNVQAFTTSFTFIPNGWNIALTIQNCANNGGSGPGSCGGFAQSSFSSGAGCEASFYQGFTGVNPGPYDIFALKLNSFDGNTAGSNTFTHSSVQIFQQNESPCNGNLGGQLPYIAANYTSTSPVDLTAGTGSGVGCGSGNGCGTTSGDTYIVSLGYDGATLTMCLADTTGGNNCTSSTGGTGTVFTTSWSNVSIPSLTAGNTAFIGLAGGTNTAPSTDLEVLSWTWTTASPTGTISSTATSDGGTHASNPTFSPVAGSYSGTQNVTVSCSGTGCYSCYKLAAAGQSTLPQPDNLGGCSVGTLYSGPVAVSSSQTLYATNGINNNTAAGTLPSGYVQGAFTISAAATSDSGIKLAPGVKAN